MSVSPDLLMALVSSFFILRSSRFFPIVVWEADHRGLGTQLCVVCSMHPAHFFDAISAQAKLLTQLNRVIIG
mgnify:CR=1 FL=1